jgi:hypothetical protein
MPGANDTTISILTTNDVLDGVLNWRFPYRFVGRISLKRLSDNHGLFGRRRLSEDLLEAVPTALAGLRTLYK